MDKIVFIKKDQRFTCSLCGERFNHTNSRAIDIFLHAVKVHEVSQVEFVTEQDTDEPQA